jgi:hypothetical protein
MHNENDRKYEAEASDTFFTRAENQAIGSQLPAAAKPPKQGGHEAEARAVSGASE